MKQKIAIFPASFDPITLGHLDLIIRASKICDQLIVIVANNLSKSYFLSLEERKKLVTKVVKAEKLNNVRVIDSNNLLVKEYIKLNADFVVRGVRNYQDFEYEVNLALINDNLYTHIHEQKGKLETIYLVSNSSFKHISSSLVRELSLNNQWFDELAVNYIPKVIIEDLRKYLLTFQKI